MFSFDDSFPFKCVVAGAAGAGKETFCKPFVSALRQTNVLCEHICIGNLNRELARKAGIKNFDKEWTRYIKKHPKVDDERDKLVKTLLRGQRCFVLDARLGPYYARDMMGHVFSIKVTAPDWVRWSRIATRENKDYRETIFWVSGPKGRDNKDRIRLRNKRGVEDYLSDEYFDLVLENGFNTNINDLVAQAITAIKAWTAHQK